MLSQLVDAVAIAIDHSFRRTVVDANAARCEWDGIVCTTAFVSTEQHPGEGRADCHRRARTRARRALCTLATNGPTSKRRLGHADRPPRRSVCATISTRGASPQMRRADACDSVSLSSVQWWSKPIFEVTAACRMRERLRFPADSTRRSIAFERSSRGVCAVPLPNRSSLFWWCPSTSSLSLRVRLPRDTRGRVDRSAAAS
ncbi:MAG: hypothetical protein SGPRY_007966 [Prymnesium sp.]